LENSFPAIEAGERDAPRDRWDPAYVVQRVGSDPDHLLSWVRAETGWVTYRGLLRGPVGVLLDRQGNALDRALLLAALLRQAGHTVRLARANLSESLASVLLSARIAEHPQLRSPSIAEPALIRAVEDDVASASRQFGLNEANLRQTLRQQSDQAAASDKKLYPQGRRSEEQVISRIAVITSA
jgi:hypothetical protein